MALDILKERYELKQVLGRNGRVVYEAFDLFSNRTVRLDVYHLSGLDSFAFRDALMTAQQLQHPNVRTIIDAWIEDHKGHVVVEWIGTYTLKDYMKTASRLASLAARVDIIIQIGAAVEWMLMKGNQLINLHPYYIVLDEQNTPFLEPFTWNPAARELYLVSGRPHYMAPELILGQPRTVRAIQYSLGTMAYELMSGGSLPFKSTGRLLKGFMKKVTDEPIPIRSYAPDLPANFDDVFAKVLAREPEDRYSSCFTFIDALRNALHSD